jgi:hypothetical protein
MLWDIVVYVLSGVGLLLGGFALGKFVWWISWGPTPKRRDSGRVAQGHFGTGRAAERLAERHALATDAEHCKRWLRVHQLAVKGIHAYETDASYREPPPPGLAQLREIEVLSSEAFKGDDGE